MMKNWGNWSYGDLKRVIEKTKTEGRKTVGIDQEHTDWQNDKQVSEWLKEMGYKYDVGVERTVIYLTE